MLNPFKKAKKVRLHLIDPEKGVNLPSVEGLLVGTAGREIRLLLPKLIHNAEGEPQELHTPLVVPRERVAFWQEI